MEQGGKTQTGLKSPETPLTRPAPPPAATTAGRPPSPELAPVQASFIPTSGAFPSGELSPHDLNSLARENLTSVRNRCRNLISRVRSRAADHAKKLYAKARASGFEEGRRAGKAELEKLLDLDRAYTKTCRDAERDCLELSVSIASEIVAQDLAPNEDLLAARIARATSELLDKRRLTIEVRPEALQGVAEALERLSASGQSSSGSPFQMQGDPTLPIGMARLSTASGVLMLDWQRHLEVIRERLVERFVQQEKGNP